jgi:hypothetical protein
LDKVRYTQKTLKCYLYITWHNITVVHFYNIYNCIFG